MQVRWLERGGLGYTPWPPSCIGEDFRRCIWKHGLSIIAMVKTMVNCHQFGMVINPQSVPLDTWQFFAGLGASWWPNSWTTRKMSSLTQLGCFEISEPFGALVKLLRSLWNSYSLGFQQLKRLKWWNCVFQYVALLFRFQIEARILRQTKSIHSSYPNKHIIKT